MEFSALTNVPHKKTWLENMKRGERNKDFTLSTRRGAHVGHSRGFWWF